MFVDGNPQGTPAKNQFNIGPASGRIGDGSYAISYTGTPPVPKGGPFYGTIDDVRIYNSALSAEEVLQLYHKGLSEKAFNPTPANLATDISINADLIWMAGERATSHDVYFGTNSTPGAGEYKGEQTGTTYDPGTLNNGTTYYWRIDEKNSVGTTTGDVWSFTTIYTHTVTFIEGANGSITGTLVQVVNHGSDCTVVTAVANANYHFDGWTGDYVGMDNPLTITNVTADMTITANFAIDTHTVTFIEGANGSITGTLVQVVNHGSDCTAVTAVANANYHFTGWTGDYIGMTNPLTITNVTADMTITANFALNPPGQATNPNPANLATDVNIYADLSWTAGNGATSHLVYFGENSTPGAGEYKGEQTGTTYDPGTLNYSTNYYWRIDEKNPGGTTTGVVWSFTTTSAPVILLQDGFETNFNKWTDGGTTDWDRATSQKYSGSYSAHAGSSDNDLISDNLNTTGKSSIRIEFWYRDDDIDDGDNIYLQLYNGSTYANKFELGNSAEDTWHKCDITVNNSGGDAQYFRSNFRIKFEGTSIDSGENLWIDDVNVTAQ